MANGRGTALKATHYTTTNFTLLNSDSSKGASSIQKIKGKSGRKSKSKSGAGDWEAVEI